ncbi:hypothetical protein BGX24_001353 [Mortierella sp. AD032]|nr:hypothetical protein BGX24_001353 [Mortierella sp. AD032]
MIQTKEYQDSVDKINRIRSYGLSKMITIPQIAILGDQSSGKSSVLEAITKLSFPRNIETCTRFATQVSLRQDDTPQMSASIDGESDFNNKYRTRDTQGCSWDVHEAVTEAKKILCADSDISEKVLEITISGPSLSPLTIIDLPDIDMPWDDARRLEEEFFKSSPLWSHVPDANKGRVSVTTFLGELLYSHIQKELPSFRKDILQLVSKYEKEIFDLGQPLLSTSMARSRYIDSIFKLRTLLVAFLAGDYSFEYISQYKSAFEKQSSVATDNDDNNDDDDDDVYDYADDDCEPLLLEFESDYRFIRSSLFRHYQRYNVVMSKKKFMLPTNKISDLVLRYKGNELPGFISFSTFTKIYMETLSRWNDLTKEHMHNINQFLYKAINRFIAFSADPLIKDMLLLEFDRFYNSQIAKIETEIDNIFKDERTPFTMNKNYYDSILKSREANAEGQIQQLINSMNTMSTMNGTQIKAVIQQHLQSFSNVSRFSDVNYNEQLAIEDLQEQLKSYCKVARKRLVDVLLQQTIERHLINSVNLYFDMLIAMDDNAINRLIESPAKQAQRKELDHKVDVLRRSLLEL